MIAFTVCVNYIDFFSLCFPRNVKHLERWVLITNLQDPVRKIVENCPKVQLLFFPDFGQPGVQFKKYAALNWALEQVRPRGWVAFLDADVLLPRIVRWPQKPGYLYSPIRRNLDPITVPLPEVWNSCPIHPYSQVGYSGHLQIVHAQDPILHGKGFRWFTEIDHAGVGDTLFEQLWPANRKTRPDFEILHLGSPRQFWRGRTTPLLFGERDIIERKPFLSIL